MEKTFLRNNIIWCEFYSKFATFTDFEKIQVSKKTRRFFSKKTIVFFPKKPSFFFSKKPQISKILRNLAIQAHSTANFLKFGLKNLRTEQPDIINWQTA